LARAPPRSYHLYNPLYAPGALGAVSTTTMLHGTANNIAGPYTWGAKPNIPIDLLHSSFDGKHHRGATIVGVVGSSFGFVGSCTRPPHEGAAYGGTPHVQTSGAKPN